MPLNEQEAAWRENLQAHEKAFATKMRELNRTSNAEIEAFLAGVNRNSPQADAGLNFTRGCWNSIKQAFGLLRADQKYTLEILAKLASRVKELEASSIEPCGPYLAGKQYSRGNVVSYGGCGWMAKSATSAPPDTSSEWMLISARGRDARGAE